MWRWSVLKDSIPEFLNNVYQNGVSWSLKQHEVESVLMQLQKADSQEKLYRIAQIHRCWDSPEQNRIFFSGLNMLRESMGDFYINMLIEEFSSAAYIPQNGWHRKEADYAGLIVNGIADIFPEFASVKREAVFDGFRIDIFAKMPAVGREVLCELKLGTQDPTPQLLKYAEHFEDPVLIGITEGELPQHRRSGDVYYFTYEMLNHRAAANIIQKFGDGGKWINFFSSEFDSDFREAERA